MSITARNDAEKSKISIDICRLTINAIDGYMKNCKPEYIEHWQRKRTAMFERMIEIQLETFDHCGQE